MSGIIKKGRAAARSMIHASGDAGRELFKGRPMAAIGTMASAATGGVFASVQAGPVQALHGDLIVTVHSAQGLPRMDAGGSTDAYVRVWVNGRKSVKTKVVQQSLNPVWEQEFDIPVAGDIHTISFDIKDEDSFTPDRVGTVHVAAAQFIVGLNRVSLPISGGGHLVLSGIYRDANAVEQTLGLIKSPFPARRGNFVTLYQDAHILPHEKNPQGVHTSNGQWTRSSYFEDLYRSIIEAQHFIYITGWSVWADVRILRERPLDQRGMPTLGELLKEKAHQGVKVALLLWDEVMSMNNKVANMLLGKTKHGMMGTWDEYTKRYFENTPVMCELAYRRGKQGAQFGNLSLVSQGLGILGTQALFTHHQKTVIMDAPTNTVQRRRVVAYVGGIDLTNGRWDTPSHSLFSTLNSYHKDDVLQRLPEFDATLGPRQPWHDIHCKVEGPTAHDVLTNFEQRWGKQASRHNRHALCAVRPPIFLTVEEEARAFENHPSSWTVQMFRSIDSHVALTPEPGVERGILDAYIHHVRRAQNFIYIENQYFLGSSTEWEGFSDGKWNVECKHRIPVEIAQKIVSKIQRGERFTCYVLIPLFPEGIPEGAAPQAILFWQYKTVQMMYKRIWNALRETNSTALPTDYLTFLCVGKREPVDAHMQHHGHNMQNERQRLLWQTRRHMIYVHSKMMIVDDEYIIIGSANINERSMAGDRDTEICVGMFQPAYSRPDSSLCSLPMAPGSYGPITPQPGRPPMAEFTTPTPGYPGYFPAGTPDPALASAGSRHTMPPQSFPHAAPIGAPVGMPDASGSHHHHHHHHGHHHNRHTMPAGSFSASGSGSIGYPTDSSPSLGYPTESTHSLGYPTNSSGSIGYPITPGTGPYSSGSMSSSMDSMGYHPNAPAPAPPTGGPGYPTVEPSREKLHRGDVHGFRMSLWHEHIGMAEPVFHDPESLECIRRVRQIGEHNWHLYAHEHPQQMCGHLMLYPYEVDNTTGATHTERFPFVPDAPTAKIMGAPQDTLPHLLTT